MNERQQKQAELEQLIQSSKRTRISGILHATLGDGIETHTHAFFKRFGLFQARSRTYKLKTIMIEFNQHVRFTYILKNIRILQRFVPEQTMFTVLDVGSGSGTLSEYLLREFTVSLFEVEISRRYKLSNFATANGSQLPFRDNSFDFVVSTDVLEHVKSGERKAFTKELLRCSKIGFVITYSNFNRNNSSQGGIKIFENLCHKWPDWYLEHNANSIVNHDALMETINESKAHIMNKKQFCGIFSIFFTGLSARAPPLLNNLLNLTGYFATRFVDPPPYYNLGITVQKSKQEKSSK